MGKTGGIIIYFIDREGTEQNQPMIPISCVLLQETLNLKVYVQGLNIAKIITTDKLKGHSSKKTMLNGAGTERVAMLADTSLGNKHLIQHCFRGERGFQSYGMHKKTILLEIMH